MMAKARANGEKVQLITERETAEGRVFDFRCPYPSGCGVPGGDPFTSTGWANRGLAVSRGKQHVHEHEHPDEPMQELEVFRAEQGVSQTTAGEAVRPEDWEF
jgi:hypothetical protein